MLAFLPLLIGIAKQKGVVGYPGDGANLWPAVSIPADVLMLPGFFGFLANLVTLDLPASNLITRQTLGWEPAQPNLLADLDNGHYFPAS